MPRCNGSRNSICPHKAKEAGVHYNYAELDLCLDCENEHRKPLKSRDLPPMRLIVILYQTASKMEF